MTSAPAAATDPATPPAAAPRRPVVDWRVRFTALSVVWGFSFLLIKVGTDGFAPLQVTLGRMAFGSAVLVAALALRRERLPRGARTWGHIAVAAFFINALPFSLFAYAELHISSSLAGICNATSPLWAMLLALVALREDRPTRRRVAGLGLGFAGVLIVLGAWRGFTGQDPLGTVLALLAAACYAVGWIYVRRTLAGSGHSHLSIAGTQLILGTAQLAVATVLFTSVPTAFPAEPLVAVVTLGTLGTGLAVLVQHGLVADVGPTNAHTVTYVIPVIATAAGVALLGEELTWNTPVGAAVILAGAALSRSSPRAKGT
ncbi:DMT family transporter [Streptomyces phytophilus]|uniref:DMT family transporter n=1 Tax=Streptomyces phytophilus TaxID=722715 RepID=UPI0015F0B002|nr:EamA family transporter [Streptomyces phytophilus]